MAGNPNPSPSTRFKKGDPRIGKSPGRPKGGVAKSTVTRKAEEKLDDMLGMAHTNIKTALRKKDVKTSMWLVDTVRKERSESVEAGVLEPLVKALETLEDVEQISQQALLLAIKGDMSFPQLKAVQEALARHSVLRGVIELSKLREEVDQLKIEEVKGHELGVDHVPSWGKLKDITPKPNGKDHG